MGSPGIWTEIRIRNYVRGCWSLERLIRISAWVEHTNHHWGDGPKQPFYQRMDINWWPVILGLEKKLYHMGHVVTTPGWVLPIMAASLVQKDSWAKRRSCDASEQSVHDCGSSSHCTMALCVLNGTVKDRSVAPDLWHYKMVVIGYFTVLSSMIVPHPQVQLSTSPRWTSKIPKLTMSEFRTLTAPNNRTTSTTSSAAKKRARARRRSWPRLTLACPAISSEFLVLVSVQSYPWTLCVCVCVSVVYYLQWFENHNI